MAYHKGRGIMFGGVHDVELSEEGIDSEFFDGLFAWNTERNRFFQLTLRRPKAPSKKQQAAAQARGRERGKADEEELLRNLAALETRGAVSLDDGDAMEIDLPKEEAPIDVKPSKETRMELPHPRFNAQLAVQDDVLFIFGGTFEKGDREFTFNDMLAIDLVKLDGVRELFSREPERWNEAQDVESEDDEEDDEDEDMSDAESSIADTESVAPSMATEVTVPDEIPEMEEVEPTSGLSDSRPHPRPFETLRDFFARTSQDWQGLLIEEMQRKDATATANSVKEIRKKAFYMAEEKWWDCREEIRALEDEQEEAGIGEVVSLADRNAGAASGGGGGARRR